ncbi:MAG: sulfatase [Roseobacter sp.]
MMVVSRPNVLLVLFDSLSESACVHLQDRLPTLSGLRAKNHCFTNSYACSPESGPARASLFTGLDMAAHGVWTDGVPLPECETTVPQVFQRNGYHTWLVGRRQLAGVSHWTTEHARLDEYHHFDWAHGPLHRSRQNAYLEWLQHAAPGSFAEIFPEQADPDNTGIAPEQRQAMARLPDDLSFNTWVGMQTCKRIAEETAAPFFGIASFVVGNTGGARRAENPGFDILDKRALVQADAALSTIMNYVAPDTIVVFTAGRGSGMQSQDLLNVPLVIRVPERPAQVTEGIVSSMEVAPTLYELASITTPERIQGQSLLTMPPRGWALARLRHPDGPPQTTLCSARWKMVMIQQTDTTLFQLYDLATDPQARNDLAGDPLHTDDLERMIDLMIDARVALEDRTTPRIAAF